MWLQKHDPDRESAVKEAMELQVERLHVMAVLQGIKKLFGPLLDDLDCVSAVKEAMEMHAGRGLHVMLLLQGIKKLFGPLLDDLDCDNAVKRPWSCR
jgi:hypothetical protein